jgi:gamma-glutamyltranspeptidase/glutathione hydrolase
VHIEEPVKTNYKGIDVYKLNVWTQGPAMLQALNILENFDLKSMGYNSARYIHTLYQAMNLAYADRDFYYGDIYVPPAEPVAGLLSKEYAKRSREADQRRAQRSEDRNRAIRIRIRAARIRSRSAEELAAPTGPKPAGTPESGALAE